MPDDSASVPRLPEYYLNAHDTLCAGMPAIVRRDNFLYTTAKAPTITKHFAGKLGKWPSFKSEVLRFYLEEQMQRAFADCASMPVSMNPRIEDVNPYAMTKELLQCGAEISLSGRFFQNALDHVIHAIETIVAGQKGPVQADRQFVKDTTFGDYWTIRKTEERGA